MDITKESSLSQEVSNLHANLSEIESILREEGPLENHEIPPVPQSNQKLDNIRNGVIHANERLGKILANLRHLR